MIRLIGLAGPAGSGKTYTAERIADGVGAGRTAQMMSFAKPLRVMMHKLLTSVGVPPAEALYFLNSPAGKNQPIRELGGKTARHALQTLGTDWGRNMISPTLWTDIGMNRAGKALDAGVDLVVFDDVRFPSEADAILERGGMVYRIVRPDVQPCSPHESETALDGVAMPAAVNGDGIDAAALILRHVLGEDA